METLWSNFGMMVNCLTRGLIILEHGTFEGEVIHLDIGGEVILWH